MANEPHITLTGNITANPELRWTQTGTPVANAHHHCLHAQRRNPRNL